MAFVFNNLNFYYLVARSEEMIREIFNEKFIAFFTISQTFILF